MQKEHYLVIINFRKGMKKNILKVAFVVVIAMVSGINVFKSQKSDALSDVALDNVEALAMDSEGSGIPWRGHTYNMEGQCCKFIGLWSVECSGVYRAC
jgi:hypothetical protein